MAFAQGKFIPKNPQKYIGTGPIQYRSSYELYMFHFLDDHPFVLGWASESIRIPYYNPFTKEHTVYIPDLYVIYMDKTGATHKEIIEIKPSTQVYESLAKKRKDKFARQLNLLKWRAATLWANKNKVKFRIMTEKELYL